MSDTPAEYAPADNVPLGLYRHFKGGAYRVIAIAKHSETKEELVIYRCVKTRQVWARPKAQFAEIVEVDGLVIPRFRLLQDDTTLII